MAGASSRLLSYRRGHGELVVRPRAEGAASVLPRRDPAAGPRGDSLFE